MKDYKAVDTTRRNYHRDPTLNSVHRASLLVPELAGTTAEISFVNHFLLKRGYEKVACRVTAIDEEGRRIVSRLVTVDAPQVYTLPLSEMFADTDSARATGYLVEFFAADNLFIPFPAVMVNHRSAGCVNTVHAYNRVLNDVFEDDEINRGAVVEASIDARMDARTDTVFVFSTGIDDVDDALQVSFAPHGGVERHASVPVRMPRLSHREFRLRDVFPELESVPGGVLKIIQPHQRLFFGRMLVGMRHADGAFSGNHSYYDSSARPEYWDDGRGSCRFYPYLDGFRHRLTVYPIHSPGRTSYRLDLHGRDGRVLGSSPLGELDSPGECYVDASVETAMRELGVDGDQVSGFTLRADPVGNGMPTRIGHQLVYSDATHAGALESSIQLALTNPNVFAPAGKTGFCWGQTVVGENVNSRLGICTNRPDGAPFEVEATFYGTEGEIASRRWMLTPGTTIDVDIAKELSAERGEAAGDRPDYVWYVVRAARADVFAHSVSRHDDTGHCSGEHAF